MVDTMDFAFGTNNFLLVRNTESWKILKTGITNKSEKQKIMEMFGQIPIPGAFLTRYREYAEKY